MDEHKKVQEQTHPRKAHEPDQLPSDSGALKNQADQTRVEPETDKLQREILDLRESLLQLREREILSLREKVNSVSLQVTKWWTVVTLVGVILGIFGYQKYEDLSKRIDESITKQLESADKQLKEAIKYYDQLDQAIMLKKQGYDASAVQIFRELSKVKPEDELVFLNTLYCYDGLEEYDLGYQFLNEMKAKGVFPGRFKILWSYNNAGFFVLIKSFYAPHSEREELERKALDDEAFALLKRAEHIGREEKGSDITLPLFNLMLLHVAKGEKEKAKGYAEQLIELGYKINPKQYDAQWFTRLKTRQSEARGMIEDLLPSSAGSENTGSGSK